MIKGLFLTASLLAPGLAYGAGPSATQSDQVVPAGSDPACTIGPSYSGSAPTPAQAAGFTTCAFNLDPTQSPFNNPSGFIDCLGASSPLMYLNGGGNAVFCGSYNIVNDGGVTALEQTTGNVPPNLQMIATVPFASTNNYPTQGVTFPAGVYVEAKVRQIASASIPTQGGALMDWWLGGIWPGSSNVGAVEWDIGETNAFTHWVGGSGANGESHNFGPATTYNVIDWHTFGYRLTLNTAGTQWAVCIYGDVPSYPTQISCNTGNVGYNPATAMAFLMDNQSNNVGGTAPYTNHFGFVRIWTCPNWQTGGVLGKNGMACANGLVTSNP